MNDVLTSHLEDYSLEEDGKKIRGRIMYIIANITVSGKTTIITEYFTSLLKTKAFPGAARLMMKDNQESVTDYRCVVATWLECKMTEIESITNNE